MRTLIIEAKSLPSARGFLDALSEFRAELIKTDDKFWISIAIKDDAETVSLLNAIEAHVTDRAHGPALVELDGQHYTLHAVS